jgi:hypothetical protein
MALTSLQAGKKVAMVVQVSLFLGDAGVQL